jgi:hypothetical protein
MHEPTDIAPMTTVATPVQRLPLALRKRFWEISDMVAVLEEWEANV